MPYFVKVGYEENNISRSTAKGYHIYRRGKHVYYSWGAIEIKGLGKKRFYWHSSHPQTTKVKKFRSIQSAEEYKRWEMEYRLKRKYTKLAPGVRIYCYGSKN